jgi:antitoxin component of RelBE/YafQ-DinJ toxin-antitoxin module
VSRGTPIRTVRVPDDLWDAALRHAEQTGTTVSEAVRALLEAWIEGRKPQL